MRLAKLLERIDPIRQTWTHGCADCGRLIADATGCELHPDAVRLRLEDPDWAARLQPSARPPLLPASWVMGCVLTAAILVYFAMSHGGWGAAGGAANYLMYVAFASLALCLVSVVLRGRSTTPTAPDPGAFAVCQPPVQAGVVGVVRVDAPLGGYSLRLGDADAAAPSEGWILAMTIELEDGPLVVYEGSLFVAGPGITHRLFTFDQEPEGLQGAALGSHGYRIGAAREHAEGDRLLATFGASREACTLVTAHLIEDGTRVRVRSAIEPVYERGAGYRGTQKPSSWRTAGPLWLELVE